MNSEVSSRILHVMPWCQTFRTLYGYLTLSYQDAVAEQSMVNACLRAGECEKDGSDCHLSPASLHLPLARTQNFAMRSLLKPLWSLRQQRGGSRLYIGIFGILLLSKLFCVCLMTEYPMRRRRQPQLWWHYPLLASQPLESQISSL